MRTYAQTDLDFDLDMRGAANTQQLYIHLLFTEIGGSVMATELRARLGTLFQSSRVILTSTSTSTLTLTLSLTIGLTAALRYRLTVNSRVTPGLLTTRRLRSVCVCLCVYVCVCVMENLQRYIRYDTRCYFNVRSKAHTSQFNLPHGTDN